MKRDEIEIELNDLGRIRSIKGCCKAKDFKAQIEKLREVLKDGNHK